MGGPLITDAHVIAARIAFNAPTTTVPPSAARHRTRGAQMTKRIAGTGAIAAMLMLMLTACGTGGGDSTHESDLTPQVITVNGREVTCVTYPSGYVGGIDCDWEGSR